MSRFLEVVVERFDGTGAVELTVRNDDAGRLEAKATAVAIFARPNVSRVTVRETDRIPQTGRRSYR